MCTLSCSTRTNAAFSRINQRRKRIVSFRWPRFLCEKYLTQTHRKCLHRKGVKHPQDWYTNMSTHCFEVKKLNNCSPKAKAIAILVRKRNNCPIFGKKKSKLSPIPKKKATFVSIYTVQNRRFPVIIKQGLRTVDCEPRTGYKTRNEV